MQNIDNRQLISLVKRRECLYRRSHPKYYDKNFKNKVWEEIATKVLEENWSSFDEKEKKNQVKAISQRWTGFKLGFHRALKRQSNLKLKRIRSHTTGCRYYDELHFLKSEVVLQNRKKKLPAEPIDLADVPNENIKTELRSRKRKLPAVPIDLPDLPNEHIKTKLQCRKKKSPAEPTELPNLPKEHIKTELRGRKRKLPAAPTDFPDLHNKHIKRELRSHKKKLPAEPIDLPDLPNKRIKEIVPDMTSKKYPIVKLNIIQMPGSSQLLMFDKIKLKEVVSKDTTSAVKGLLSTSSTHKGKTGTSKECSIKTSGVITPSSANDNAIEIIANIETCSAVNETVSTRDDFSAIQNTSIKSENTFENLSQESQNNEIRANIISSNSDNENYFYVGDELCSIQDVFIKTEINEEELKQETTNNEVITHIKSSSVNEESNDINDELSDSEDSAAEKQMDNFYFTKLKPKLRLLNKRNKLLEAEDQLLNFVEITYFTSDGTNTIAQQQSRSSSIDNSANEGDELITMKAEVENDAEEDISLYYE